MARPRDAGTRLLRCASSRRCVSPLDGLPSVARARRRHPRPFARVASPDFGAACRCARRAIKAAPSSRKSEHPISRQAGKPASRQAGKPAIIGSGPIP